MFIENIDAAREKVGNVILDSLNILDTEASQSVKLNIGIMVAVTFACLLLSLW